MKFYAVIFGALLLSSCAHHVDRHNLPKKIAEAEVTNMQDLKADLEVVLSEHKDFDETLKKQVMQTIESHLSRHQELKELEFQTIQVILQESLTTTPPPSLAITHKKLTAIYDKKAMNIADLLVALREMTAKTNSKTKFYEELNLLIREIR
ncbi:MAG: hypothetical protein K2P81_10060 [Bacteriovoracaceae bacterium]|nr:hypothetical protein [Bacteriovoracaceae bacterium]